MFVLVMSERRGRRRFGQSNCGSDDVADGSRGDTCARKIGGGTDRALRKGPHFFSAHPDNDGARRKAWRQTGSVGADSFVAFRNRSAAASVVQIFSIAGRELRAAGVDRYGPS